VAGAGDGGREAVSGRCYSGQYDEILSFVYAKEKNCHIEQQAREGTLGVG